MLIKREREREKTIVIYKDLKKLSGGQIYQSEVAVHKNSPLCNSQARKNKIKINKHDNKYIPLTEQWFTTNLIKKRRNRQQRQQTP